jgi:methylenetetrahydrofolate dehydrogenase (NADP+)/methenyltetrahydrofolate cyclohydrolase
MAIIDGNKIAAAIIEELKTEVAAMASPPCICFVRVGEDPASVSYVNKKNSTAAQIGIRPRLEVYPESITQAELEAHLDRLNADPGVHGILVQAPLPVGIDERAIFQRIDPRKDVDGFHPVNLGKLVQEDPNGFVACTPAGILELLRRTGIDLAGKHVVVVGRSTIVGKPVGLLALQRRAGANATVTFCHSRTPDLPAHVARADVLIAAIGKAEFIRGAWLKPGAVVIDVGINRVADATKKTGYRLVGDVAFAEAERVASHITPVPGGVGPMTVAILMKNTVAAAKRFASGGAA